MSVGAGSAPCAIHDFYNLTYFEPSSEYLLTELGIFTDGQTANGMVLDVVGYGLDGGRSDEVRNQGFELLHSQ